MSGTKKSVDHYRFKIATLTEQLRCFGNLVPETISRVVSGIKFPIHQVVHAQTGWNWMELAEVG